MWRDGSRVPTGSHHIAVNGTGPSIYLVHVVQAEAQRAALAMDYLMIECGPKFDQGF